LLEHQVYLRHALQKMLTVRYGIRAAWSIQFHKTYYQGVVEELDRITADIEDVVLKPFTKVKKNVRRREFNLAEIDPDADKLNTLEFID
jgi:hypothetical protein